MAFIFGGDTGQTQESITDARRRLALAMIQQGSDTSPIRSAWQGAARLADAVMGNYDLYSQQQQQKDADGKIMSAITGQPYTPPAQSPSLFGSLFGGGKGVPASSDAQGEVASTSPSPSASGAADTSGLDGNQVYSGFMDTVKSGVQNPYALAAVASTGKAESGFSPKMMNASWADPSGSGQPGTAGGLMSWRNERLANLRNYAQANGEDPGNISPQMQGRFFLQENPQLIAALNGAKSVGEAQDLMNRAWAFRGYNVPGNANAAHRLATAQALLPSFQQAGAPAATADAVPPAADPTAAPQPTPAGPVAAAPVAAASSSPAPQPTQVASLDPNAGMPALASPQSVGAPLSPTTVPDNMASVTPGQLQTLLASPAQPGYRDPQVAAAQTPDNPGPIPVPTPRPDPTQQAAALPASGPPAARLSQAMQNAPSAAAPSSPMAGNPRAAALMAAMMNPNASPGARSLAGAMLQQQMAPQYDMVTRPDGSIVAVNKINPSQSMQVQGPMKSDSIVDGPADPQTGLPTKLVWNPVDGVKGRIGPDGSVQPAGSLTGAGVQSQQPTVDGNPIPPGVDPKKYREEMASRAATQASPSAKDEEEFANGITERPSYKEFSAAVPTWNSFTQHIQDNSPAADKAIVDDFAKILNPGRSVTTGSFQLNMDAQSVPEYLQGQILKAFTGDGELGPDARAQMARIAQIKMQQYKSAWDIDSGQASKIAKAHGLNTDNVIPQLPDINDIDFSKINSVKTTATGTAAAPAKQTETGPVRINGADDYNKLPSGAQFIDPNGVLRTKR